MVGTEADAESPPSGAKIVEVPLGDRGYGIRIGSGILTSAAAAIDDVVGPSHVVVIADEAVGGLADSLVSDFRSAGKRVDLLPVPSGEPSKSIERYGQLLDQCLRCHTDRQSVIVALGGGVVGDLAGFVAATYTRGIRLVQIPTTLLSMVDSSVGGKTGVNLPGGKNMVGSFWQPRLVLIDPRALRTLGETDYVSGLAEVIKYGVIGDGEFFAWLEANMTRLVARDEAAIQHAVATSCQCKADVVVADERETSGRRATLNYGHTFAHAIEATTGYGTVTHGQAVAIGMRMAMELASRRSAVTATDVERQSRLIAAAGLPPSARSMNVTLDADAMYDAMSRDKKVAHGRLRFILPTRIGHVDLVADVDPAMVRRAIEHVETATD